MKNVQAAQLKRMILIRVKHLEKDVYFKDMEDVNDSARKARQDMYEYTLKYANEFNIDKSEAFYKVIEDNLCSVDKYKPQIQFKNPTVKDVFYAVRNETYHEIRDLIERHITE